jgi:hypothetical protein
MLQHHCVVEQIDFGEFESECEPNGDDGACPNESVKATFLKWML